MNIVLSSAKNRKQATSTVNVKISNLASSNVFLNYLPRTGMNNEI